MKAIKPSTVRHTSRLWLLLATWSVRAALRAALGRLGQASVPIIQCAYIRQIGRADHPWSAGGEFMLFRFQPAHQG